MNPSKWKRLLYSKAVTTVSKDVPVGGDVPEPVDGAL